MRYRHATSAATALSTTAVIIPIGALPADGAEAVPDECVLDLIDCQITDIASGATSVTWRLCRDSAGDHAITDSKTGTIIVGKTTATDGGFAFSIDTAYHRALANGTAGQLYVVAATDAGTCNATFRLTFRRSL